MVSASFCVGQQNERANDTQKYNLKEHFVNSLIANLIELLTSLPPRCTSDDEAARSYNDWVSSQSVSRKSVICP